MSYLVRRLLAGEQHVVHSAHGQHGQPGFLGQHGRGRHEQGGSQAGPLSDRAALGDAAGQAVQVARTRAQAQGGEDGAHRRAQSVRPAVAAGVATHDAAPRVRRPVPVPDVRCVAQERGQVEQAGEQVGATHDTSHGLGVHRVDGEHGRGRGGPAAGHQRTVHGVYQIRDGAVQQNVCRVVALRVQAARPVVQPERGHAQRTIRAVGAARPDRRAPEVVGPNVGQRRGSRHVRVVDDRPTGNTHKRIIHYYTILRYFAKEQSSKM